MAGPGDDARRVSRQAVWEWRRCHVHYRGVQYTAARRGYFIRRCEFDDFLLRRSGADLVLGHRVKTIERAGAAFVVDRRWRTRYLIGAGGTHCPVSRQIFGSRSDRPVGARELEFPCDPEAIARSRAGRDGEPELLLHDDLRGYSWNIPKTSWLNVGCGTLQPGQVRASWSAAADHFHRHGHLPGEASAALESMRGHSYYLYDPDNLERCHDDGAFLVGDSLGVAQPMTAEGILPSVISGAECARSIVDGAPETYPQRLARHPVLADYSVIKSLLRLGGTVSVPGANGARSRLSLLARAANPAIAQVFAWMFAGKSLPARRLIGVIINAVAGRSRLQENRI